ncbi:YjcL [Bacillus subtilis subsp. subtilis str. RO-NN-1]|nr:YjcL [Bacillus subtilis subsp. subtilis str. RO-NN-1]
MISSDDVWVLWGFIAVWASAVSEAILALLGAMVFTNEGFY